MPKLRNWRIKMPKKFLEGYDSFYEGIDLEQCPYNHPMERQQWRSGWLDGQTDSLQL